MAINGSHAASSNYVTTAASAFLQPGRTITVMCWANPNVATPNGNYYTVLGTATVPASSGWAVALRGISGGAVWDAAFTANGTNYDDYRFTNQAAVGRWDHVAWVLRSDSTEAGYLNGVAEALLSFANAGTVPPETSRGLQILNGDASGNGSFGGAVAFVRIFDGELGADEVAVEMSAKRAQNRRLPVLFDMPDPYLGVDWGPLGLHVASVTGTVTWAPDPQLPEPALSQLSRIRMFGTTGGGPTPISVDDTGSAAETLTTTATADLGDSGAGADTATVTAAAELADAGSGADTVAVAAATAPADAAGATETLDVTATTPLDDAGTADQSLDVAATTPLDDAVSSAESLTAAAAVPLADTAGAAETLGAAATTPLADAGSAVETLTATAAVELTDSGSAADALLAGIGIFPADAGAATDALDVTVAASLTDTGSSAETLTATAGAGLADSGAASDTLTVTVVAVLPDAGFAADAIDRAVLVLLTDAGTASDALEHSVQVFLADAGTAVDTLMRADAASAVPARYVRMRSDRPAIRTGATRPTIRTSTGREAP